LPNVRGEAREGDLRRSLLGAIDIATSIDLAEA
jgi:hypothetical protein